MITNLDPHSLYSDPSDPSASSDQPLLRLPECPRCRGRGVTVCQGALVRYLGPCPDCAGTGFSKPPIAPYNP